MNIITKIKRAIAGTPAQPVAVALATTLGNDLDKAIVAAKATEIGTAAIAAVKAAEVPGATGAEKKAQAIAAVVPVVVLHVAKTGLAATVADLETFAGLVIESTLADLKATGIKAIAAAVLKLALAAV